MTPYQVAAVAVLGGLAAVVALVVVACLGGALYCVAARLVDAAEVRRMRRQDLSTCRAIDELGTTNHPKE
ncbi:hypothetical protein ABZ468_25745 [Streptomyces sp. NPDC005708]|uniref:hypothetical protein n=1 Tax=Streptomyces sp. NPDC005708 TaxID=3154564 RepID=UPI0033E94170